MGALADWTDVVRRAALSVGAEIDAPTDGPSLSVVFRVSGVVQGAAHARFRKAPPDGDVEQFVTALETQANAVGHELQVVWAAPSRGPHRGVVAGPVVCLLEPLALPRQLSQLHITQTIDRAQQLGEASVLAVGNEMRGIFELARSHADGLKGLASQFSSEVAAGSERTVSSHIDELSAHMHSFGEAIVARTDRQAREVEQARVWTRDIIKLGEAIAGIASNARLLAFNARLEAAHIGELGKSFNVIADSIQDLANQVRRTNESVGELATHLAAALPRLGADAFETSQSTQRSVGQLGRQFDALQARLAGLRSESWDALSDSADVARELQGRANVVIHHLQFQDRASQLLAEAVEQTRAVIEVAGLRERPVDEAVLAQVGHLGRDVTNGANDRREGSVELF